MMNSERRSKIENWIKNTFETRKMNPMTLSLDYYPPQYRLIDEPAQPLVIEFLDNYITVINDNPDEYPRLHVPFITRGIAELQVSNRTIENWDDVPVPFKKAYLDKCKIPPLDDIPSTCQWWIKINHDHRENIIPAFDRKDLNITIRISNSAYNKSTTLTKHHNDIWADADGAGIVLTDVFELQNWLIENGFETLV